MQIRIDEREIDRAVEVITEKANANVTKNYPDLGAEEREIVLQSDLSHARASVVAAVVAREVGRALPALGFSDQSPELVTSVREGIDEGLALNPDVSLLQALIDLQERYPVERELRPDVHDLVYDTSTQIGAQLLQGESCGLSDRPGAAVAGHLTNPHQTQHIVTAHAGKDGPAPLRVQAFPAIRCLQSETPLTLTVGAISGTL